VEDAACRGFGPFDWKRQPTAENLAAVDAANRNRSAIEAELAEACLQDQSLINEAKRRAAGL
jgi:hypothetical protein